VLACLLAYVLIYLLMFSDKHNSRIARPRDLISSLINVTLSQDVPFHQPQQLQCLNHGANSVPLCATNLHTKPLKMTICGRHIMASVQDIKIAEPLLILCLAYYVIKTVQNCWNWGVMAFTYPDMGCTFHEYILRVFRYGWMDYRKALHGVFCYIAV